MGTGGRWRRGGSCEAWEGLLSLSLVGAGLMLKPVDRSDDDDEEDEDSVGILKVFDPVLKRISLV